MQSYGRKRFLPIHPIHPGDRATVFYEILGLIKMLLYIFPIAAAWKLCYNIQIFDAGAISKVVKNS